MESGGGVTGFSKPARQKKLHHSKRLGQGEYDNRKTDQSGGANPILELKGFTVRGWINSLSRHFLKTHDKYGS
jgi:hypothetical protein